MTKRTQNTLRIISVVIALLLVLMEIDVVPNIINYHFWVMVIAYALLFYTTK